MPKALITGGAGFIGSHVADRFLDAGYEVHILDNFSSGRRENVAPKVVVHELDVRSPEAAKLAADKSFSVIAHLAAQIDVRKSVSDPKYDADVNVAGTINLLEALKSRGDAENCRFVFISTGGALYGEVATSASDELTPKNPDAPYGIAKLSAELYAAYYGRIHKVESVVLRLGNVYGPRQDPNGEAGVVSIFVGKLGAKEPVTVFGDGRQTRDYVYVGDVARAVFSAATVASLPAAGPVDARAFNIATGVGTSVLTLARELGRIAGGEPTINHAPERRGEIRASVLDCSKAKKLLGWEPEMTLSKGLETTYAWFQSRK